MTRALNLTEADVRRIVGEELDARSALAAQPNAAVYIEELYRRVCALERWAWGRTGGIPGDLDAHVRLLKRFAQAEFDGTRPQAQAHDCAPANPAGERP